MLKELMRSIKNEKKTKNHRNYIIILVVSMNTMITEGMKFDLRIVEITVLF